MGCLALLFYASLLVASCCSLGGQAARISAVPSGVVYLYSSRTSGVYSLNEDNGARNIQQQLKSLGLNVVRSAKQPDFSASRPEVYIVPAPTGSIPYAEAEDLSQVAAYIKAGGLVILAGGSGEALRDLVAKALRYEGEWQDCGDSADNSASYGGPLGTATSGCKNSDASAHSSGLYADDGVGSVAQGKVYGKDDMAGAVVVLGYDWLAGPDANWGELLSEVIRSYAANSDRLTDPLDTTEVRQQPAVQADPIDSELEWGRAQRVLLGAKDHVVYDDIMFGVVWETEAELRRLDEMPKAVGDQSADVQNIVRRFLGSTVATGSYPGTAPPPPSSRPARSPPSPRSPRPTPSRIPGPPLSSRNLRSPPSPARPPRPSPPPSRPPKSPPPPSRPPRTSPPPSRPPRSPPPPSRPPRSPPPPSRPPRSPPPPSRPPRSPPPPSRLPRSPPPPSRPPQSPPPPS